MSVPSLLHGVLGRLPLAGSCFLAKKASLAAKKFFSELEENLHFFWWDDVFYDT